MITLSNCLDKIKSGDEDIIVISPIFKLGGSQYFKICKDIKVELSNGDIITIPVGFRTDLSSVPNILWFAFSPYGNFLLGALIHDYLYVTRSHNRKFADLEMYIWSKSLNPKRGIDNILRYWAVRAFGGSWYNKRK